MNAQHFHQQGFIHGRKGLYKEAVADFTLKPDFAEAYIARAHARGGTGDNQGAIKDLQQAANIYQQRGELEKVKIVHQVTEFYQNDSE
ncbi:MAG: hypothetical protein KME17_24515 [Cyanosarcina radialis HA8281-LM2]|jgi:hypothetical protein|nr:hypothetical protein [Cyanosarcina radialis HA8281-LM2]